MRVSSFLTVALVTLAPSLALAKSAPAPQDPRERTEPVRVGAVLPANTPVIVQPDGVYGIVIRDDNVIVIEAKSRKIVEILQSGI